MCERTCGSRAARRQFLKATGVSVAALATGLGCGRRDVPAAGTPPQAMPEVTPADVLELLAQGNRRFAAGAAAAPRRDLGRMREVALAQAPLAAFLGCADSRVPVEIVFDQGFGDLFVTRVAGNVASPEVIGSLEFGTAVLGVKVLYVLGHTACGAVSAAVKGEEVPGQISTLFQHLRPAVRAARGDAAAAIRENVRHQASLIAESSPLIARLVSAGRLRVAGGVYDLATGRVTPVEM